MVKGTTDIYALYLKKSRKPVPYKTFKEILIKFNGGIMEYILDGGTFVLGSRLSDLYICRMTFNPKIRRVDWNASNNEKAKLIEEGKELYDAKTGKGEQWLVYRTSEYLAWKWLKGKCAVKNKAFYRFNVTRGKEGNKAKLTALTKNDDLAHLKYRKNPPKIFTRNGNLQERIKQRNLTKGIQGSEAFNG